MRPRTTANGVKPEELVGDNAYGAGANIRACNELGVEVHTKQPRQAHRGAIPKQDLPSLRPAQQVQRGAAKGGYRVIRLSLFESELQQNRAFAATQRGKEVLRARSSIEHLLSHLVRMGMRHARFFTMKRVQLQAYMVAAAHNLQRIFTLRAGAATGP